MKNLLGVGLLLLVLSPLAASAGQYTAEYGALVQKKEQWVNYDQQLRAKYEQWQGYRATLQNWYNLNQRNPYVNAQDMNYVVGELNRSADVMNQLAANINQATNMIAQFNQALVAEYNRGALQGQARRDAGGGWVDNSWWHGNGNGNNGYGNNGNGNGSSGNQRRTGNSGGTRTGGGGNSNGLSLVGQDY
jgi:hypothetical protein